MKRQIVCSHKCSQVCTLVHKQLCTLVHFRYQSLEEMYIPKRISFQEKTLYSYKSKTAGKICFIYIELSMLDCMWRCRQSSLEVDQSFLYNDVIR